MLMCVIFTLETSEVKIYQKEGNNKRRRRCLTQLNCIIKQESNALLDAVKKGNKEECINEIAKGADVNSVDEELCNTTGLMYAAVDGDLKIINLLLEKARKEAKTIRSKRTRRGGKITI